METIQNRKSKIQNRTRVSWKTVIGIAILTTIASSVITVALLYSYLATQSSTPVALTTDHSTPTAVAALGRLEPQGEVIYLSAPAFIEGARVEQLFVKLGDKIKSGQVIAVLDNHDRLQAAYIKAQTEVQIAQARLSKIQAGAQIGEINAQKATIGRIEAELAGQISTQQATIARIHTELDNATTDCQRYRMLYENGAISAAEKDNICLKEATFREQLAEAQANRDRTITTLHQQLTEAQATLAKIVEIRPVDVTIAEAQLQDTQANLRQAKANLDLSYVRSPITAQVLKIHTFPGEIVGEKGIIELGNTEQMYAIAEVYETDIHQVQLGQSATITSTGFVGELLGTVDEIGLQIGKKDVLGTDPAANVDARVVDVKIRLDQASSQKVQRLTNLQVNIIIYLGE